MKNKTLFRFLKTYLSFIVCILLIMIPTYNVYFKILRDNERNISTVKISNGMDLIDNEIMSLISLSQTTYADTRYRLISASEKELPITKFVELSQIQNNFKSLISTQALVSDAGILLANDIFFTRHRNFYNYQINFYNDFFTYGNLDENSWNKLLRANVSGRLLPAATINSKDYDSYEAITYVCSWPPNNTNNSGVFYAAMKAEDILTQLVTDDVLKDGYVLLYDSKGNLLLNHQQEKVKYKNEKFQTITYEGKNMKVEVGIPDSLISVRLTPVRNLLWLFFSVTILISLLVAVFFAYRNSNPLRKLLSTVSRIPSIAAQQPDSLNEYDYIANAVTSLDQKVNSFARTIEVQKENIRMHLFEKALNEGLHSKHEQEEFEKNFIDFPKGYQIASFNFSLQGDAFLEILVPLYEDILENLKNEIYIQTYGDRSIIILLPIEEKEAEDFWEESLKKLQSYIIDTYDLDFKISLSERFNDYKRLPEAYAQIRSIELLSDIESVKTVWQLKDFPKRSPNMALDFSTMQQLYDVLHLGDFETAKSIMDSNLQSIHSTGYVDEIIIKQIFYNFRNILLRVKLENYEDLKSVEIPIYEKSSNVHRMFDTLTQCCKEICIINRKQRETSKARFYDTVCEYIRENFSNADLYAKMAANQFSISETTLQKIVQSTTGKTFFEYVEDLRLEKAYNLLKTTSNTVNNIAAECGFSSQNSFYKAFKRRFNQSPGAVR